jgi:hypothetical protein
MMRFAETKIADRIGRRRSRGDWRLLPEDRPDRTEQRAGHHESRTRQEVAAVDRTAQHDWLCHVV